MAFSRVNSAFIFTANELLNCVYHIHKITAENWNGKFCSYAGRWKKWCTLSITISVTKIKPQSLTQVSCTYIDNREVWQGRTTPTWGGKACTLTRLITNVNWMIPWTKVLKKLIVHHLGLLPCSQEPTTGLSSKPHEYSPHPISSRSISILPSTLCSHLPSGLFPSDSKPSTHHSSPTCLTHLLIHNMITLQISDEECRSWSSSLCNFTQPLVTSCIIGPKFLFVPCFPSPVSYSINMTEQVSHPSKTQANLLFCMYQSLHIVIKDGTTKQSWPEW